MGLTSIRPERVVGLDLSTNTIAFSLFVNGKLERYGELNMYGEPLYRNYLANHFARFLRDELKPDLVAYESAVFMQSKKTVITLSYAFGAVVSSLMGRNTSVKELVAIEWQNFIKNKALTAAEKKAIKDANPGKTERIYKEMYREFRKERTIAWVKENLGVEVESNDVADAIAIGYTAVNKVFK